ncbi:hypothetical protein ABZ714_16660, partial [Streptomyces sp. NPDC006798]|uniref:hypothetical protein n=1 Tax=Streptomyces sp. NPDC006798 TaxID=3155462 RepID=UPI0033C49389
NKHRERRARGCRAADGNETRTTPRERRSEQNKHRERRARGCRAADGNETRTTPRERRSEQNDDAPEGGTR